MPILPQQYSSTRSDWSEVACISSDDEESGHRDAAEPPAVQPQDSSQGVSTWE